MADLYFDHEADRTITAVESDVTRELLANHIHRALSLLAADPNDTRVRRRRFQIGLWGIPVSGSDEEWIILWEPYPERQDAVIVHCVGPASFA